MLPNSFRLAVRLFVVIALSVVVTVQAQAQAILLLENAYPNVAFDFPIGMRFPDDGSGKAYVVERAGIIKVLDNDEGAEAADIFLDISERFATDPSGDLFAIEFHPDYEENGYFFARYKLWNPHRAVLSRFSRSDEDPLTADPDSEVILFEIELPSDTQNHQGGDLAFGLDGYLYVPIGDGGAYRDPDENAQDRSLLVGNVLRLDVDNPAPGLNYGIPPDNPYVGNSNGWREEIFAYGFRNPWRLSVDRATGDIWLGDVGETTWEEVDLVQAGRNYGWPIMEGPVCAPWEDDECDQSGLTQPVWSYTHEVGNSVVGGYVYRGFKIPVLHGKYVFLDFGTKKMWAIERDAPSEATLITEHGFASTSFGEDPDGELYINKFFGGEIYKLVPGPGATDTTGGPFARGPFKLSVYPQPATRTANFYFESEAGRLRLNVYDILGREVAVLYDEEVGPGARRTVTMDTSGLASGIYIARLEGRGEVETKRMVVVR